MRINSRSNFTSNRQWFQNVLSGKDVILCHTSALECLGQFPGYVNEEQIDVYATAREPYENKKSFDGLNIAPQHLERFNGIKDWAVEFYAYE
jgi:hypothetical protein